MSCRIASGIRKTHSEKKSSVAPKEGVCGLLKNGCNEMSIKTISRSEFDRLVPQNPALESWMVEQVEWFSGSTDIEVTKSSEDRLVPVRTAVHPQEPLGLAGIPSRWKFSCTQSEG
jgi:hypothetical protein